MQNRLTHRLLVSSFSFPWGSNFLLLQGITLCNSTKIDVGFSYFIRKLSCALTSKLILFFTSNLG